MNLLWKRSLRLWREDQVCRRAELERVLERDETRETFQDFCAKSGKGRERALAKLRKWIDPCCAAFIGAGVEGGRLLATWAVIRVDDMGAAVHWLCLERGRVPRCGMWELEVLMHALGRFVERSSPGADLTRALISANDAIRVGRVYECVDRTQTLIPAGRGAFVGEVVEPPAGGRFVLGKTWLADGMEIIDHPGLVVAPGLTLTA